MKSFKNVTIQITEDQKALLEIAASKNGLTIGPFMRMAALRVAETMQLHYQQPQAD